MSPRQGDGAKAASPSVAGWVRSQRKAAQLTQEEVVRRLERAGLPISRGHFASLEQGRGLRADHIVALDHVFNAGGALIELAETEWGTPIRSGLLEHWARLGQGIHEDWVQLAESASPSSASGSSTRDVREPALPHSPIPAELDELRAWWETVSDGDVFESPERIESAVVYLLTLAAADPRPELRPPIEFSGAFEGFRKAGRKAGLPRLIRNAIRGAMEKGWECRHHIPMHPDDVDSTTLVYVASPLIACPNFSARTVNSSRVPLVENLLVIPGLATVQFYATSTTRRIDAAVIHKRPEARRVIEERIKQIASASEAFEVQRFERSRDADVTANEVDFQRLLTEVAALEGECSVLAGEFPSATIPPSAYDEGINERRQQSGQPESGVWDQMRDLHRQRVASLQKHLKTHRLRVIVTEETLAEPTKVVRTPDDDYTKVYLPPESQIAHLENVKTLMRDSRALFEVGIAYPDLAARIARCKWEVRDRGPAGALIVHTDYTPPITRLFGRSGETAQVDLKIESDTVVKAFSAFFRDMWNAKTEFDPQVVERKIDAAIRKIRMRARKS